MDDKAQDLSLGISHLYLTISQMAPLTLRMSQVARILNKGLSAVGKALLNEGIEVHTGPNTKITREQIQVLARQFDSDELLRLVQQDDKELAVEKPVGLPGLKVLGKIDINALDTNRIGLDKKKPVNPKQFDALDNIEDTRKRIGIPEHIYKYYTINDYLIDSLKHHYFFYNNPSNFNDPFDCSTRLVLFTDNYEEYHAELVARKSPIAKTINRKIFQQHREEYIDALEKSMGQLGVVCFSRKPLNILMWSHYGHNHTGLCLEFKYKDDENIHSALDVHYTNKFIATNIDKQPLVAIGNMTYTKAKDWEYEEELRIQKVGLSTPESRKIPFDKRALTKIIFGVKCSKESVDLIKNVVNESKYPNVKFYKVLYVEDKFALEMKEVEI